ncbi:hypothetical protein DFS34DRAFT_33744 [Phlyctochytrium arcticum]|nr:hypothetical protein DFS34DRAFT_33744 [Phlyctochytrium arcticum]
MSVFLERQNGSLYLNTFNPLFATLFKFNHDIRPMLGGEAADVKLYVMKYSFKPQVQFEKLHTIYASALRKSIERETQVEEVDESSQWTRGFRRMKRQVTDLSGKMEVVSTMAALYLLRKSAFYESHEVVQLYIKSIINAITLEGDVDIIFASTTSQEESRNATGERTMKAINNGTDYLARPETADFDDMCLFQFTSKFIKRKSSKTATTHQLAEGHPQRNTHRLESRKKPVFVNVVSKQIADLSKDDVSNDELERSFRMILFLFKPYRSLACLRTAPTWEQSFYDYADADDGTENYIAMRTFLRNTEDHYMGKRRAAELGRRNVEAELRENHPDVPVVLTSGDAGDDGWEDDSGSEASSTATGDEDETIVVHSGVDARGKGIRLSGAIDLLLYIGFTRYMFLFYYIREETSTMINEWTFCSLKGRSFPIGRRNVSYIKILSVSFIQDYDLINSTNNTIVFKESGNDDPIVATVPPGNYTIANFGQSIASSMTIAGSQSYSATYNQITRRITLTSVDKDFSILPGKEGTKMYSVSGMSNRTATPLGKSATFKNTVNLSGSYPILLTSNINVPSVRFLSDYNDIGSSVVATLVPDSFGDVINFTNDSEWLTVDQTISKIEFHLVDSMTNEELALESPLTVRFLLADDIQDTYKLLNEIEERNKKEKPQKRIEKSQKEKLDKVLKQLEKALKTLNKLL